MPPKYFVLALCGAVVTAGCQPANRAEDAVAKWQLAAQNFDEAVLDVAIDKERVQQSYEEQLNASVIRKLEADPEVAALGIAEVVFESQATALAALARDYASTRGTRAILTRCDPRTQTDDGYNKTPQVLGEVVTVAEDRAEYRCEMPGSDESIRAVMTRLEDRWIISRVELPSDMPDWAGPSAS